jgi:uncharacterized protein YcaQ
MPVVPSITLQDIRRAAVVRSLGTPATLGGAIARLGFVQADPIRAPARAQDLTLRHRAAGYCAGDLDRQYSSLEVEEDVFVNYGFVSRSLGTLMHPRGRRGPPMPTRLRARQVLDWVRARGEAHPRDVDAHFAHGRTTNYWGGSSKATTHVLDDLHYRGLLRVARREKGIRIYAPRPPADPPADAGERRARIDALVDAVVSVYAPLTGSGLATLVRRLRYGAPQWRHELAAALSRARRRLATARVDGIEWFWPADEQVRVDEAPAEVRLLAPFDPIVWDRPRFETLWGWAYRFEAYTPVAKRKLSYYALPLLWRDRVIGWGTATLAGSGLHASFGYVAGSPPRERPFRRELDAEIERMRRFLMPREGARTSEPQRL